MGARGSGGRVGRGRLAVGALVVVALALGVGRVAELLPSLPNPFATDEVDRTQPALLQSLEDLSRYEAARANFEVVVDSEKDARFLPSVIRGERTLFVGSGSVEAFVDFSQLDERSIRVSDDRRSVEVTVPAPTLSEPRVDPERSRVVSRDRGILDRVGSAFSDSPTSDRPLYLAAEEKMQAAAQASDLRARAEHNTRQMLERTLQSLGFTDVTVTFAANPA